MEDSILSSITSKKILPTLFFDETLNYPLNFQHLFNIYREATFGLFLLGNERILSDPEYQTIFEKGDYISSLEELVMKRKLRDLQDVIRDEIVDSPDFPIFIEKYLDSLDVQYGEEKMFKTMEIMLDEYIISPCSKMGFFQLKYDEFPSKAVEVRHGYGFIFETKIDRCISDYMGEGFDKLFRKTIKKTKGKRHCCSNYNGDHRDEECPLTLQGIDNARGDILEYKLELLVERLKHRNDESLKFLKDLLKK